MRGEVGHYVAVGVEAALEGAGLAAEEVLVVVLAEDCGEHGVGRGCQCCAGGWLDGGYDLWRRHGGEGVLVVQTCYEAGST